VAKVWHRGSYQSYPVTDASGRVSEFPRTLDPRSGREGVGRCTCVVLIYCQGAVGLEW